jgi:2'-5' RNA ligase
LITPGEVKAVPVTLKDVANKVGFSVTTVSRALGGYDDVAEETRRLIVRTAKEMGYRPNIMARRLQKQRTDTLDPRFPDPFFINSRFAIYLIPPYEVARDVSEMHRMLRKQFGFIAADRFQVHVTIKGFFKKIEGPLEPLIERLDAVFADQRPFTVHFSGFRIDRVGIGLDVSRLGEEPNPEMMALRERVVEAVRPFIAPDCDFVGEDLGHPFEAHITLAFRDIPPVMQDEVLNYVQEAPLPTEPFTADTFHFLEFFSQDWGGDWEQTLSWRLLESWKIKER